MHLASQLTRAPVARVPVAGAGKRPFGTLLRRSRPGNAFRQIVEEQGSVPIQPPGWTGQADQGLE